jgi:hypothetical protein
MLGNRQPALAALENEVSKKPRFTIAREAGPCTVLTLSDALADDERGEVVLNA